jgi:pimeloyl-ACP methyl ester carboxylesterase
MSQEAVMQAGGSRDDQPVVMRRDDGGRDEVEFFGDGELLFGCRHVPAGDVRAGLVVCPSILSDSGANYQREVRLGRQLAAAGIIVQRFHPRGTGHSDGDGSNLTLDTLVEDARAAVALLRERCAVDTVMVLGTRFGALVASAIAGELDDAPVVLWEPTIDPRRFLREGLRARAVHLVRQTGAEREDPEVELDRAGFVDLLGLPVGRGLFETPAGRDLVSQMGERPRPVLLVQMDQREDLRPDFVDLVDRWTELGFAVTTRCCPCDETWWYVHDRLAPAAHLLDVTTEWLVARSS